MKTKARYSKNERQVAMFKRVDVAIILMFLLLIVIGQKLFATDTLSARSKITNVTVFFSGAQVTRSANLKLNKGKHLVKVERLPQELNAQSIQVEKISSAKILSVKHELNHRDEGKKGAEQTASENKIEELELKLKEIANKLSVFDMEEKLLIDNSHIDNSGEGSKVKDIKEAADFYRSRLNEIRQEKLNLNTEAKNIKERIKEVYTSLNEITAQSRKTYSRILVLVECDKEISADLNLSYYIASAGWEPAYDFRVDDISKPLVIVYNANVYQSSGEDWKNVNIRLSNNNPTLKGSKPELPAWYIGNMAPRRVAVSTPGISAIKGRVLDASNNESLPFANVSLLKGNEVIASSTTDIDGQYAIKPIQPGSYNAKVSYVGYKDTQVHSVSPERDKTTFLDIRLQPDIKALQSVEIVSYNEPFIDRDTRSGSTVTREDYQNMASRKIKHIPPSEYIENKRGSRRRDVEYYIDGAYVQQPEVTDHIANSLKRTVANLEYVIEIPYTIPADGEDYNIKIKDVSMPVQYVYYAVPKLEAEAFLTAEIHDWTRLNLLSGKSSIYYQGTFTGESFIDVNTASDTLSISLGRDKSIIVKREGNKLMSDKRVMANNIKQTLAWDITVKNNRNTGIKIIVEDQYPVSERKSIEVEAEETSGAKADEKTGLLKWELNLAPNEKKMLANKYSIKYPKGAYVAME